MGSISKLNLNRNPATSDNRDLLYAKNIVATNDQKAVRNEDGFLLVNDIGNDVLGKVELPDGYVLFKHSTIDSIICVSDTITKTISSSYLGFNKPIKGRYTYNANNDLLITFTEGVDEESNETRIINISQSNTTLSQSDVQLLDMIPNVIYPTMTAQTVSGGRILSGVYQIAFAYQTEKGNYTNYSILSEPIYAFGDVKTDDKIGNAVNMTLRLSFSNLDTKYSKFKMAILYKGLDEFENTYETKDLDTSLISYDISSLSTMAATDIKSVLTSNISYVKDQDHASFNGSLIRGNVKTINYNKSGVTLDNVMATVANNIHVGLSVNGVSAWTGVSIGKRHFKEGEHYVLYIGCFDYKGNFVNAYPIYHKDTDATEGVLIKEGGILKIHRIPYIDNSGDTIKKITNITCILPSNIDTLLGVYSSTITSFCYFYAEHDLFTSKILGQGFMIRDTHINSFNDNQNYRYAFKSNSKVRFYSLEHLFNKSTLSNAHLYNTRVLNGFNEADDWANSFYDDDGYVLHIPGNTSQKHSDREYSKIISERRGLLTSKVSAVVNSIDYTHNDNVVANNIAGDSFHRLNMSSTEIDKIFGSTPAQTPQDVVSYGESTGEYLWDIDNTKINHFLMSIGDLVSNNDYFYNDLYDLKLAICSPIIAKNNTLVISLSGDFFYDNFTIRCTTPCKDYKYGTNNLDDAAETKVFKCVISICLESRFNLKGRFKGVNDYERVYTIQTKDDVSTIQTMWTVPYKYDNFINTSTGKGYSLSCNYNGYDSIAYTQSLDIKYHFFNRVIRSAVNSGESNAIGWRNYATDNYKDLPANRRGINIVEADERTVYIQQEYSLSVVFIKDMVSNNADSNTYLGSSDIFDRAPIEVMFDANGYIGCDNRFGAIMTPMGYVVVDTIRRNIFVVKTNNAEKLNDLNVDNYFKSVLKFNHLNPYAKRGITLLYDDIIKSIFITQQGDVNFTIHYNFVHKAWLSFHDYIVEQYISTRTTNYVLKNNKLYKRNHTSKCIFFDVVYPSQLIYIYNASFEEYKQFIGLSWDTIVRSSIGIVYKRTFDNLIVFNDTQCTDLINVNKNVNWFDIKSGVNKRDVWMLNDLKDMVLNDQQPFIDTDYNLLLANIKTSKNDWFSQSNFMSKWIAVKFVYLNKYINLNTDVASSTPANGFEQLSLILNDYDINAIKAQR